MIFSKMHEFHSKYNLSWTHLFICGVMVSDSKAWYADIFNGTEWLPFFTVLFYMVASPKNPILPLYQNV